MGKLMGLLKSGRENDPHEKRSAHGSPGSTLCRLGVWALWSEKLT